MSNWEESKFKEMLLTERWNHTRCVNFLEIFTNIETEKMEASQPKDLDIIKKFMTKKLGGFSKVNETVSSGLRQWIGKTAMFLCETFSPGRTKQHVKFLLNMGSLFGRMDMFEHMLVSAVCARKISEELNDEISVERSKCRESEALSRLGRCHEALILDKEQLEMAIKKFGERHHSTMGARYNLGVTYMSMKVWEKAEEEITIVLEGRKVMSSFAVVAAKMILARILRDSEKNIERAQQIFKEILVSYSNLKPNHIGILVLKVHHARCLALKGQHAEALTIYRKALPGMLKTHGESNRDVKNLRIWMREAENSLLEKKTS